MRRGDGSRVSLMFHWSAFTWPFGDSYLNKASLVPIGVVRVVVLLL
jgi:hypothetical protein